MNGIRYADNYWKNQQDGSLNTWKICNLTNSTI